MIQSIELRATSKVNSIKGFEKINLIGGHNDYKSTLFDALEKSLAPNRVYYTQGISIKELLCIELWANVKSGAVWIAEIENSLHHTTYKGYWRSLFQIANKFDIQIFATTHSLEIIEAFADVATENADVPSVYIELFNRPATGAIDSNAHSIETLRYEIANKMPIRG